MELTDINSLSSFIEFYWLPIIMSLLGGVIGHYNSNGVIYMPIVVINYEKTPLLKDKYKSKKDALWLILRGILIILDFIAFLIGFRLFQNQTKDGIHFHLGFFGEMLVGIATGILAKSALLVAGADNTFSLILVSLLAGFAGLAYIKNMQDKHLNKDAHDANEMFKGIGSVGINSSNPTVQKEVTQSHVDESHREVAVSKE